MEPSRLARLGLPAVSRKKNFPESHIINTLLTKFVRSRWLDLGLVGVYLFIYLFIYLFVYFFFCEFMDLDFVSVQIQAKKELGQYPAISTSHLVNNPYALKQMFSPKCKSFWKSHQVSYPTSASGAIVE